MSYEELHQACRTAPEAVVTCGSLADAATENADYHRHPAVSKSHLDSIARSPLHYWSRYLDPQRQEPEPTAAMRLGTAVHTLTLEASSWDERYVVAPQVNRRTNEGKALWASFQAEAAGRELISAEDRVIVSRMAESVWRHPAAGALLNTAGEAETTHMWVDASTELECKCRPDWLLSDGSKVIDLKTTEDASPAGFRKSIGAFRYHVQAAWYLHGLELATGQRPEEFIFICVEKKPPYAVAVYVADQEMIDAGWKQARWDLDKLAVCKAADSWPSYSDQIEPIGLPGWMRPRPDGASSIPIEIEMF